MAKKAQDSSKSKAKVTAKKAAPAKAKAAPAKPAPSKVSKPAASAKAAPKVASKPAKVAAKPVVEKAASRKPAPVEAPKALSKAPEKVVQAAESSEKIKIDKNMTEEQVKWVEMYNKYKDSQAAVYDMKATFKAASAIQHKVLGWGWIVSNENDRLEVLFRDGKRMLISNYRG